MKVPGIEEMVETFMSVAEDTFDVRAGLLAVFETHVKGMLADLYVESGGSRMAAERYASDIIAQLKGPRHD